METLLSAIIWIPLSIWLAVNNTEISLGEAYMFVCDKTGGEWHNPVPADLQEQFGKANAGCYYAEGEYPMIPPQREG